jgi:hypothetical protein
VPLHGRWPGRLARTGSSPTATRATSPHHPHNCFDLDRPNPVHDVMTLEQALNDSIRPRRFNTLLLGILA